MASTVDRQWRITAIRATARQARAHFALGGSVLVAEEDRGRSEVVTPLTTTWNNQEATWEWLSDRVAMFRNRYPRQTYYLLPYFGEDS